MNNPGYCSVLTVKEGRSELNLHGRKIDTRFRPTVLRSIPTFVVAWAAFTHLTSQPSGHVVGAEKPPGDHALAAESGRVRQYMATLSDSDGMTRRNAPELKRRETRASSPTRSVALVHLRQGQDLASRGAFYLAKSEFLEVLRSYARELDSRANTRRHSESLARGMRALSEAEDFVPGASSMAAELQLGAIVEGHKTVVLKNEFLSNMLPTHARNLYFKYAKEQFAEAFQGATGAADGLYAMGRVLTALSQYPDLDKTPAQGNSLRALVFHQAALTVDPKHFRSANELGVLLARHGQLEAARAALDYSVSIAPTPETIANLAKIYRRLGREDLAVQVAAYGRQVAEQNPQFKNQSGTRYRIVTREQFNKASHAPTAPVPAMNGIPVSRKPAAQGPAPKEEASGSWWQFWNR